MPYLLDTHALLWFYQLDKRVSKQARHVIEQAGNYVSAITAYEITLKFNLNKLAAGKFALEQIESDFMRKALTPLPITFAHTKLAGALPLHHRDPFDRLLIAQAITEKLTIVTNDPAFAAYDVKTLWQLNI